MDETLLNIYNFKFNKIFILSQTLENSIGLLTMDDPLLNIYSFKFNEVYIFWNEVKNPHLRWMIHC